MRQTLAALLLVMLPALAGAQTNPCTVPRPVFTVINSRTVTIAQVISDYDRIFNGAPVLTALETAVFPRNADPNAAGISPVANVLTLKAAWKLVATNPNCYQTVVTFPDTVQANTEYDLYARALKDATPGLWFDMSERVPFGLPGPPAAPSNLRITRSEPPSERGTSSLR